MYLGNELQDDVDTISPFFSKRYRKLCHPVNYSGKQLTSSKGCKSANT